MRLSKRRQYTEPAALADRAVTCKKSIELEAFKVTHPYKHSKKALNSSSDPISEWWRCIKCNEMATYGGRCKIPDGETK